MVLEAVGGQTRATPISMCFGAAIALGFTELVLLGSPHLRTLHPLPPTETPITLPLMSDSVSLGRTISYFNFTVSPNRHQNLLISRLARWKRNACLHPRVRATEGHVLFLLRAVPMAREDDDRSSDGNDDEGVARDATILRMRLKHCINVRHLPSPDVC